MILASLFFPAMTRNESSAIRIAVRLTGSPSPVLTTDIVNLTAANVTITGKGLIELGATSAEFWAPFDLELGRAVGANRISQRILGPGECGTIIIRLADLRWARILSSTWPDKQLSAIVPTGTYTGEVVIETDSRLRIRSNTITIHLPDSGIESSR